jgi:hypothetical protein
MRYRSRGHAKGMTTLSGPLPKGTAQCIIFTKPKVTAMAVTMAVDGIGK